MIKICTKKNCEKNYEKRKKFYFDDYNYCPYCGNHLTNVERIL